MSEKKIKHEAILHYILLVFMIMVILCAVTYAYIALQSLDNNIKMPVSEVSKGKSHPLPDFIVDKIKSDELEQLKP